MAVIDDIISIYDQFISLFPLEFQWVVSLIIFIAIVVGVFNLIKQNFIFLILLILIIPASIPILLSIFEGLLAFLQHIL